MRIKNTIKTIDCGADQVQDEQYDYATPFKIKLNRNKKETSLGETNNLASQTDIVLTDINSSAADAK